MKLLFNEMGLLFGKINWYEICKSLENFYQAWKRIFKRICHLKNNSISFSIRYWFSFIFRFLFFSLEPIDILRDLSVLCTSSSFALAFIFDGLYHFVWFAKSGQTPYFFFPMPAFYICIDCGLLHLYSYLYSSRSPRILLGSFCCFVLAVALFVHTPKNKGKKEKKNGLE